MFSVAVYAQDFVSSETYGMLIDKFSPQADGGAFGRSKDSIRIFGNNDDVNTPFQNVQIIASGKFNEDDLGIGFINNIEIGQKTQPANYVGKKLGVNRNDSFYAKAQFQKNWDFNALPTPSQASAINTYLTNQFNITF